MKVALLLIGSLSAETGGGSENFTSLDSGEIATAFLPPGQFEELEERNELEGQDAGIIFAIYDDGILFPIDRGGEMAAVGTPVVSAIIAGQEVENLENNVLIILRLNPLQDEVGYFLRESHFSSTGFDLLILSILVFSLRIW